MRVMLRMAAVYRRRRVCSTSPTRTSTAPFTSATRRSSSPSGWPALGARVAVPTSLNVSGLDEHGWRDWPVPPEWAAKAHRQMVAYQSMGADPTWTCAPYQTHARPAFGQQIAWGESNAICVRQLGDRRAHRALSRPVRHLLRDHRPRAGGRPAPDRAPRRRDPRCGWSTSRAPSRRTRRSVPCSAR